MNKALVTLLFWLSLVGSAWPSASTRDVAWPSSWDSPLSSDLVKVTTNYQALSGGCSNADLRDKFRWYLKTPSRAEHLGLDVRAGAGTTVYAIADGRATAADDIWGRQWRDVLIVTSRDLNGRSWSIAYGHVRLATNPRTNKTWKVDDLILRGEVVGEVWKPDVEDSAAHLHLSVERGITDYIRPSHRHAGKAGSRCNADRKGTSDPEKTLRDNDPARLVQSIVGFRDSNGRTTKWQIVRVGSKLRRRWIPSNSVYECLLESGHVDWGTQPARFLDQLEDENGRHAQCER